LYLVQAACSRLARADAPPGPPPPDPAKGEPSDGRAHPPRLADDLLTVPRILLAPLRLVWKALGKPIEAIASVEEKHQISRLAYLLFTTENGVIGVRPAVTWTLSFAPFFGAEVFHRRLFGRDTIGELSVMVGGADLVELRTHARPTRNGRAVSLDLFGDYVRRDDQLFGGVGDSGTLQPPSRYQISAVDTRAELRLVLRPEVRLLIDGAFGWRRFEDSEARYGSDLPISRVYCVRVDGHCVTSTVDPRLVPGFREGTQFLRVGAALSVDTRDHPTRPSSGARIDLRVDYSHGLADDRSSYVRAIGALMGALDLWQRSHVLVVGVFTEMVFPTGDAPVPFTEQAVLGGPDSLRGYRTGRFRDLSSLFVTAEYRWPLWMWMDAALFVDEGGVFGYGFDGFSVAKLRPDVGVGLRVRTSKALYCRLQTAWSAAEGFQLYLAASTAP
jgi:hypothetical protein